MLRREKEKSAHQSTKDKDNKHLLDWKLDYYDGGLQKEFNLSYNEHFVTYFRVGIIILSINLIVSLIFPFLYDRNKGPFGSVTLKTLLYYLVPNVAWYMLFFVLLQWKKMRQYSTILGSVCLVGICISHVVVDEVFGQPKDDPDAYTLVSYVLLFFVLIRIPIKYAMPILVAPIIVHAVGVFTYVSLGSWYYRLALTQLVITSYIVSAFSVYWLEKRAKYDFVRTKIAEVESDKLSAAIGRDVSLLRNIFPKNLSDELEMQVTTRKANSAKSLRRTITKNSSLDAGVGSSTEPTRNPLVKIISSFNSRESAGWRALQTISPLPTEPEISQPTSRDITPQHTDRSSPTISHHIDVLTPHSDSSGSSNPTPRMNHSLRIDASTPRAATQISPTATKIDTSTPRPEAQTTPTATKIDTSTPRSEAQITPTTTDMNSIDVMLTSRNGDTIPPITAVVASNSNNSLSDVTPRNTNPLSFSTSTTQRGRSNTANSSLKTPRNVVPIFRKDSHWQSFSSLPPYNPASNNNAINPSSTGGNAVESPQSSGSVSPPSPMRTVRALIPPLRLPNLEPTPSPTSPLSRSLPGFYPISPTRQSPQSNINHSSRARNYLMNSDGIFGTSPVSPNAFSSAGSSYTSSASVSRESSVVSLTSISPPLTPLAASSSDQSVRSTYTARTNTSNASSNSTSSSSSGSHNSSGSSENISDPPEAYGAKTKRRLSVVIPSESSESMALSHMSHSAISPSAVYSMPPIVFVPPSPMGTPTEPPIVSSMPPRALTSSGRPLNTHHGPELYTFFNGAQHADGSLIALSHSYSDVSVILVDIVGFTALSSTIAPQELVDILNTIFSMFDDVMQEYQLEKIRTIGDAYLCVGNMSIPLEDHQNMAVEAAYRMLNIVRRVERQSLTLRVGIASGPLIAGVTGTMKWNYDIFGVPLAQATLMETSSPPGCVSVTKSIFEACQDNPYFTFEMIEVEGDDECKERFQVTPTNALVTAESEIKLSLILRCTDPALNTENLDIYVKEANLQPLDADLIHSVDSDDRSNDIPMTDMSQNSERPASTFAKETLEREISRLNWRRLIWRPFKNPEFESAYQSSRLDKTRPFMILYTYLLTFTVILYVLSDLAASKGFSPWSVYFFHLIQVIGAVAFIWLISKRYEWRYTELYTLVIVGITSGLSLIQITPVAICTLSLCTRTKPYKILIILLLSTLIGAAEAFLYSIDESNEMSVFLLYPNIIAIPFEILSLTCSQFYAFAISVATQMFIEKSFRMEFLVRKLIDVNVLQHKHAQHRAKLLLHNILPIEIIPRLQRTASKFGPQGVVDLFEDATIMFVNIVNLGELTENLYPVRKNAADTFNLYNEIFTQFDEATRAFGLEKIKTINSVYMVASGLPRRTSTHAEEALQLAHELHAIARSFAVPPHVAQIRIGLASGPVVAGIIGKTKYAYDCWSDTVNTASRMESNGFPGCVQVTPALFNQLQSKSDFILRKNIFIKGKGHMNTYFMDFEHPTRTVQKENK